MRRIYKDQIEIKEITAAITTLKKYRDNEINDTNVDKVKSELAKSYDKLETNQALNAQKYILQVTAGQSTRQPANSHFIECTRTDIALKTDKQSEHIEKTGKLTKQWWKELGDAMSTQFYAVCKSEIKKAIALLTTRKDQLEQKKTSTESSDTQTAESEKTSDEKETNQRESSSLQTAKSERDTEALAEEKTGQAEQKLQAREEETNHKEVMAQAEIDQKLKSCEEIIKQLKTSIMDSKFKLKGIHDDIENLFSKIKSDMELTSSNSRALKLVSSKDSKYNKEIRKLTTSTEKGSIWNADKKLLRPFDDILGFTKQIRSDFLSGQFNTEEYAERRLELHETLKESSFINMFDKKYRIITPMSLMVLHQAFDEYLLGMIDETKLDYILTQVSSPYFARASIKELEQDQLRELTQDKSTTPIPWGIESIKGSLSPVSNTHPEKITKSGSCFRPSIVKAQSEECAILFETYLEKKSLTVNTEFKVVSETGFTGQRMSKQCFDQLLEADRIRQWLTYYQKVIEQLNGKLGQEPAAKIIQQLMGVLEGAVIELIKNQDVNEEKTGQAEQKSDDDEEKKSDSGEKKNDTAHPKSPLDTNLMGTLTRARDDIPVETKMNKHLVELRSICHEICQLKNPWKDKNTESAKAKASALLQLQSAAQDYQSQFTSVLLMDMVTLDDLSYESITKAIESTADDMQTKKPQSKIAEHRITKRTSTLAIIRTAENDIFMLTDLRPSHKICCSLAENLLRCCKELTEALNEHASSAFKTGTFVDLIARLEKFTTITEEAREDRDREYQDLLIPGSIKVDDPEETVKTERPTTPTKTPRNKPPAHKPEAPQRRKTAKTTLTSIADHRLTTFAPPPAIKEQVGQDKQDDNTLQFINK